MDANCELCGSRFSTTVKRRFCSRKCYVSWASQQTGEKNFKWRARPEIICAHCGKAFKAKKPYMKLKYCSRACYHEKQKLTVKKKTIQDMNALVKGLGGLCLSNKYIDNRTALTWKCKKGHIWTATPNSVDQGHWCPKCALVRLNEFFRDDILVLRKLANERGGRLISTDYRNNRQKLEWACKHGHRWLARSGNVKKGTWCPICSYSLSERFVRSIFEQLLQKKFPKVRPDWLRISTYGKLELDGYNEKLNLAFEYQGVQHYKFLKNFYADKSDFERRKKLDAWKREQVSAKGIKLVEIPYTISKEKLPKYVEDAIVGLGYSPREKFSYDKIEHYVPAYFDEIKKLVEQKKGRILSKRYLGSDQKLVVCCERGHRWGSTPDNLKSGAWCQKCYDLRRGTSLRLGIDKISKLISSKGGKLKTENYANARSILTIECEKGHVWKTASVNIMNKGHWCPYCSRTIKLTIADMEELGRKKGGECLSKKYVNNQTNLLWKCKNGHVFSARPDNIKSGTWCPKCRREGQKSHKSSSWLSLPEADKTKNGIVLKPFRKLN